MIKLTPVEWELITGIEVVDPDGWDGKNLEADWKKPLTFDEFFDKIVESTITGVNWRVERDGLRRIARLNIVSYV